MAADLEEALRKKKLAEQGMLSGEDSSDTDIYNDADLSALVKERLKELPEEKKKLREEYAATKERGQWGELGEKLGHALTQLGAGYAGMQSGADLSGLKFDKTDWQGKAGLDLSEYKGEQDTKDKEMGEQLGLAGKLALRKPEKAAKEPTRSPVRGAVEKGTKLPVFLDPSSPTGYSNALHKPAEVIPYEKDTEERVYSDMVPDQNLLTESGQPVYRLNTKSNTGKFATKLVNADGSPLQENTKTKVGIDPKAVLDNKQIEKISDGKAAVELLDRIGEQTNQIEQVGRVNNTANTVAQWLNMDDKEFSAFKGDVTDTLNRYIKTMTGAQMTTTEAQRLMSAMPKMTDKPDTFKLNLQHTKDRLQLFQRRYIEGLKKAGKRVPGYEDGSGSEKPAENKVAAPGGQEPKVETKTVKGVIYDKKPDGKWYPRKVTN